MVKGQPVSIYVLVEHNSYSDRWVLLQILRYMVQTWSADTKDNPVAPRVPILPILFYHGEAKTVTERFSQLFSDSLPEALRAYQVEFLCDVYNLTAQPDSTLRVRPRKSLTRNLACFKMIR
ncbi:MAG: hypothetical protein HKM05_03755 [Spirochaetales bacterium]|nr:hypothetical protein [Spirochaetales bacterium]